MRLTVVCLLLQPSCYCRRAGSSTKGQASQLPVVRQELPCYCRHMLGAGQARSDELDLPAWCRRGQLRNYATCQGRDHAADGMQGITSQEEEEDARLDNASPGLDNARPTMLTLSNCMQQAGSPSRLDPFSKRQQGPEPGTERQRKRRARASKSKRELPLNPL